MSRITHVFLICLHRVSLVQIPVDVPVLEKPESGIRRRCTVTPACVLLWTLQITWSKTAWVKCIFFGLDLHPIWKSALASSPACSVVFKINTLFYFSSEGCITRLVIIPKINTVTIKSFVVNECMGITLNLRYLWVPGRGYSGRCRWLSGWSASGVGPRCCWVLSCIPPRATELAEHLRGTTFKPTC